MSFLGKLRSIDFYRKINRELTEGTVSGSAISVATAIIIVFLVIMEFSSFVSVKTVTRVVVDRSSEELLRINFNLTFPHLECQFASVDVSDVLGHHKVNITKNVSKWKVDKQLRRVGQIAEDHPAPKIAEVAEVHEKVDKSTVLGTSNWDAVMAESKIVLVNFFAPWCPWSRKLAPVWEHTAELVSAEFGKDVVQFAKVDCTAQTSHGICHSQHVNAFPSIRVYRGGSDTRVTGLGHEHNAYYGDRTPEAILAYVKGLMTADDLKTKSIGTNELERDGEAALGEGCTVAGFVRVARVPGNMHVSAVSHSHSFDAGNMNFSHIIHEFSFGDELTSKQLAALPEEARQNIGLFDGRSFFSKTKNTTHDHYIKVVLNTFQVGGEEINTYEFTANSNKYLETTANPMARFSYDLSPLQVLVQEERMAFTHFLTQLCAIVGGVFTVAGILDSIIFHGVNAMSKKLL